MNVSEYTCRNSLLVSGPDCLKRLRAIVENLSASRIAVLMDVNTEFHCKPLLEKHFPGLSKIIIPAGEQHKHLETCQMVWDAMLDLQFDRKSVLINLGGGMVGDLGGFAASTFKRGLRFVQIPTTLLAMVDASIGGKTGVDYRGYKNTIGLFREPEAVFISAEFLNTLPRRELLSGFAEVIKHTLIADKKAWEVLLATESLSLNWNQVIPDSFMIKARIVEEDPFEKGIRKALNFGHTLGHAIEGHFLEHRPTGSLLHGEAVAAGMICECWISTKKGVLPEDELKRISTFISSLYPQIKFEEAEIDSFMGFMKQDKKNEGATILCTLLEEEGRAVINKPIDEGEARESLAYYSSLFK